MYGIDVIGKWYTKVFVLVLGVGIGIVRTVAFEDPSDIPALHVILGLLIAVIGGLVTIPIVVLMMLFFNRVCRAYATKGSPLSAITKLLNQLQGDIAGQLICLIAYAVIANSTSTFVLHYIYHGSWSYLSLFYLPSGLGLLVAAKLCRHLDKSGEVLG